jgi:hypothetical protein
MSVQSIKSRVNLASSVVWVIRFISLFSGKSQSKFIIEKYFFVPYYDQGECFVWLVSFLFVLFFKQYRVSFSSSVRRPPISGVIHHRPLPFYLCIRMWYSFVKKRWLLFSKSEENSAAVSSPGFFSPGWSETSSSLDRQGDQGDQSMKEVVSESLLYSSKGSGPDEA